MTSEKVTEGELSQLSVEEAIPRAIVEVEVLQFMVVSLGAVSTGSVVS